MIRVCDRCSKPNVKLRRFRDPLVRFYPFALCRICYDSSVQKKEDSKSLHQKDEYFLAMAIQSKMRSVRYEDKGE